MPVFNERAELNKQGRHVPASWDNSFGLKLLGYNSHGKDNAWGHVLNFIPGINTGRHALAQATSTGDTKKVLKDTLDEAIARDFATAGLAVNIAKLAVTAGASGAAGAAAGGAGGAGSALSGLMGGGKMSGMMGKMGGKMGGLLGGGKSPLSADDAANVLKSAKDVEVDNEMLQNVQKEVADQLINPYEEGTPEFIAFENKKAQQQGGLENRFKDIGSTLKNSARDFIKDAGPGGNIFESLGNAVTTSVADYRAKNEAFSQYARGMMVNSPFNYL